MTSVNFYKIVCGETNRVYVGSTVQQLEKRLKGHESDYRRYLNKRYHFMTSFIILEKNNYTIHLIENAICNYRGERNNKETFYINQLNGVNKIKPGVCNNAVVLLNNPVVNAPVVNAPVVNVPVITRVSSVIHYDHKNRNVYITIELKYITLMVCYLFLFSIASVFST
jgi:hypothetical protein